MFHSDVTGLESEFDNLNQFLGNSLISLDIVAMSGTSEREDTSFVSNVDFECCYFLPLPVRTKVELLFMSTSCISHLKVSTWQCQCCCDRVFVEISNSRSKTIVCGSKYGHPNYDLRGFLLIRNLYWEPCEDKKKKIYLCRKFNVKFWSYESQL